jgi:DnaJ-class molecular chaperone
MADAARLFETSWEKLKEMDVRSFSRLYRKMALKHHPDRGGNQEAFVKLTQYYQGILNKKIH